MTSPSVPQVSAYVETMQGRHVALVQCPHCGDMHQHGAGPATKPPDLGYRAAHCLTGPGGSYRLVPGLTEKPRGLTYRARLRRLLADDRARGITYPGRSNT
jgi:hypothetical protein